MKRTIKNLFPAPTDSRTGGARLGARMLPAPTHLRRLFVALVALLTMTAQTAWADSWTNASGTGGSGTAEAPYYVNMPSNGTATTIGSAKTLNVPDGITTFKVYDDNGKSSKYSNDYTGYLVITAPAGSVLLLSGSIVTETNYDKLTVYDNGTASDPKLLDGVSGTVNDINIISSGNVMTILFTSDNSRTGTLVLTAPSGYQLQVTGSAPINYIQDYLCIYDGTDTSSPILFTQEDKDYNRTDNIKVLTSSSQN